MLKGNYIEAQYCMEQTPIIRLGFRLPSLCGGSYAFNHKIGSKLNIAERY